MCGGLEDGAPVGAGGGGGEEHAGGCPGEKPGGGELLAGGLPWLALAAENRKVEQW